MPNQGYPTKGELKKIKRFYGTLPEFFDYVESLWVNGAGVKREEYVDEWGHSGLRITFVTGGWSGCETTIGVVTKTMASLVTHSMWKWGGLFEFDIRENYLKMEPTFWGSWRHYPKESA